MTAAGPGRARAGRAAAWSDSEGKSCEKRSPWVSASALFGSSGVGGGRKGPLRRSLPKILLRRRNRSPDGPRPSLRLREPTGGSGPFSRLDPASPRPFAHSPGRAVPRPQLPLLPRRRRRCSSLRDPPPDRDSPAWSGAPAGHGPRGPLLGRSRPATLDAGHRQLKRGLTKGRWPGLRPISRRTATRRTTQT